MYIDPKLKEDLKQYLLERLEHPDVQQKPKITIYAPYELETEDMDELKEKIKLLDKAEIKTVVDPSILGGFVIRFGSQVIDVTVNAQLQTLAQTLYETA